MRARELLLTGVVIAALLVAGTGTAAGEVIVKKDGTRLKGEILRQDHKTITIKMKLGIVTVQLSEVKEILKDDPDETDELAAAFEEARKAFLYRLRELKKRALEDSRTRAATSIDKLIELVKDFTLAPELPPDACTACDGTGRARCPDCKGAGRARRACSACGGKGRLPCPFCVKHSGWIGCETCKGKQTVGKGRNQKRCPKCYGRGMLQCPACEKKGWIRCRECDGKGLVREKNPCSVCGGLGSVTCLDCGGAGKKKKEEPSAIVPPAGSEPIEKYEKTCESIIASETLTDAAREEKLKELAKSAEGVFVTAEGTVENVSHAVTEYILVIGRGGMKYTVRIPESEKEKYLDLKKGDTVRFGGTLTCSGDGLILTNCRFIGRK